MSHKQTIITVAATAAITSIVGLLIASFAGLLQKGADAETEEIVRRVIRQEMVTEVGGEEKTHGEMLATLFNNQVEMKKDIERYGEALEILSSVE